MVLSLASLGMAMAFGVASAANPKLLPTAFTPPPPSPTITTTSTITSTPLRRPIFIAPPPRTSRTTTATTRTAAARTTPTIKEIEAESEQLRKEIEILREEALRRLEAIDQQLSGGSGSSTSSSSSSIFTSSSSSASNNNNNSNEVEVETVNIVGSAATTNSEEGWMPPPAPIVITPKESNPKEVVVKKNNNNNTTVKKGINSSLDETKWKINLSIGREPGTWMPNTWGVSGQRLNLSFTAEFTPSQLYERDDFLRGGYSNAKTLHVLDSQLTLGPSISEGQRIYNNVKDGGWQVTRGDGPMGTDMLRFYIEVEEEISRGDVYVPKGRIYCSCGYFPCRKGDSNGSSSMKDAYLKELKEYDEKILKLEEKKASTNFIEGIKISREIFKLKREAERTNERLTLAKIREPDKSLLKFSKDGDVGLTREGGVCCRVDKGLAVEYHILGRFSVANKD